MEKEGVKCSMDKDGVMNEILSNVKTLVPVTARDNITPQTKILSEQVVDSLGIIQLVSFLETQYSLKISQDELNFDNLDSVEQMAEYIMGKQS